jgi:hypothetical protein
VTPANIQAILLMGILPAKPINPIEVTIIKIVGPINANTAFILKAVSTRLNFSINKAAENSIIDDKNLMAAILKTILSKT